MKILTRASTQYGELKLVEGMVEVLHEMPMRNSVIMVFPSYRSLHSISAISTSGENEKILGEIDLVLFQEAGMTWLHAFEFKTTLKPRRVIKQVDKAKLVADLIRLWLEGRGIRVLSWSYTILVRKAISEIEREYLRERLIGVISWNELSREGKGIMRRILKRDVSEIRNLKVITRRPRKRPVRGERKGTQRLQET